MAKRKTNPLRFSTTTKNKKYSPAVVAPKPDALAEASANSTALADEITRFNRAIRTVDVYLNTGHGTTRKVDRVDAWHFYFCGQSQYYGDNNAEWADLLQQAKVARNPRFKE